jgi:hypothetical protein
MCVAKIGGTADGFTPHVSLLYGQVAAHEKAVAAKEVEQRLRGKEVLFDRVVVTNSSDNVPINEWRMHEVRTLGFRREEP